MTTEAPEQSLLQSETGTASRRPGSAGNALVHGLTASRVLAEDRDAYAQTLECLNADYQPSTPFERALVHRMARLIVRIERAHAVEVLLYAMCWADDDAAPDAHEEPDCAAGEVGEDDPGEMILQIVTCEPMERTMRLRQGAGFDLESYEYLVTTINRYETSLYNGLAKTAHELERQAARRKGQPVASIRVVDVNL